MTASNLAAFLRIVETQFKAWDRYKIADDILQTRFGGTRNNDVFAVYEKTALLDRLYGTNVFDAFRMAEHIIALKIDSLLDRGDPRVIEKIRTGHGITVKKSGKERNLYSFATKYASWHRPKVYPIYDGLIGQLLPKLNETFIFYDSFDEEDLQEYSTLVAVTNSLTTALGLEHFRYKRIDKALWLWAKHHYRPKQVRKEIAEALFAEAKRLKIRL